MNILRNKTDERQKQFDIERDRFQEPIKSLEKTHDELMKENQHLNGTLQRINDCQNELFLLSTKKISLVFKHTIK